jgi:N-methylhydantoinase A
MLRAPADLEDVFAELEERGRSEFEAEQLTGTSLRSLDLRYQGQGYELNVPFGPKVLDAFHDLHRLRYGFAKDEHEVEVVNVRVRMVAISQPFDPGRKPLIHGDGQQGDGQQALTGHRPVFFHGEAHHTPVYNRAALIPGDTFSGPAIITEYSSATILPPGDSLRVDELDNLIIEVH